jgi:hypothetical protein
MTLFGASDQAGFSRVSLERLWQIGNALRVIALKSSCPPTDPRFSQIWPLFVAVSRGLSRANSAVAEPSTVLGEHTSPCFNTMHRILASKPS